MDILDRVKENTATTGTGTVTLSGSFVSPYQTWSNGGAVNGRQYCYLIEQGSDSEWGVGTYTSGSPNTFSRDTVYGSIIGGTSGTTKITLAGSATIACVMPAEFLKGRAPTLRGTGWGTIITSSSVTISLPAGSQAGDFIVAFGGGGNGWNPSGSGWTTVFQNGDWWSIRIFTKTLTAADITTGSVTINSAPFANYHAIAVFAPGAYVASVGFSPLTFMNSGVNAICQNPAITPQVGKVDANPNMLWLLMVGARAINTAQGVSALSGGVVLSTIGSGTSGNGSGAAWTANWGTNLAVMQANHNAAPQIGVGDIMIGVLA